LKVFTKYTSSALLRARERVGGTLCYMVLNNNLVLSSDIAIITTNNTSRTHLLSVCFKTATEDNESTLIGTVDIDKVTSTVIRSREVIIALCYLQDSCTTMKLVGTVDFQLRSLSALLLQKHTKKVSRSTERAGFLLLQPLIQTSFAEALFTAVDQVRLIQHFHTNRAPQFLWELFYKLVITGGHVSSGVNMEMVINHTTYSQ